MTTTRALDGGYFKCLPQFVEPGDAIEVDGKQRIVVLARTSLTYRTGASVELIVGDPYARVEDRVLEWTNERPVFLSPTEKIRVWPRALPETNKLLHV